MDTTLNTMANEARFASPGSHGHGKNHASENFCMLNLLSFQFHTILGLIDEDYQSARASVPRCDEFFNHLRAALRYGLHDDWQQFIIFVRRGPPDG
jgi:hypothetical protein